MSKKTHKMGLIKEEAKTKKPAANGAGTSKRMAVGRKPQASAGKPAPGKGAARSYDRPAAKAPRANVLTVRIMGLLTAVLAIGGGIYWIIQVQGNPPAGVIVGLVVLGFVAALGILSVMRAEELLKSARAAAKR